MDWGRRAAIKLGGVAAAGLAGCLRSERRRGVPDGTPIRARAGALLLPWSGLPVDRRWYQISRDAGDRTGSTTFVTYGERTPSTPRDPETAREHGAHLLDHRVEVHQDGDAAATALQEWANANERDPVNRDTRPDVGDAAAAVEPPDGGDYHLRYRENNVLSRFADVSSEPEAPAIVLEAARSHVEHLAAVATETPTDGGV